jgi:hypothetical protein
LFSRLKENDAILDKAVREESFESSPKIERTTAGLCRKLRSIRTNEP